MRYSAEVVLCALGIMMREWAIFCNLARLSDDFRGLGDMFKICLRDFTRDEIFCSSLLDPVPYKLLVVSICCIAVASVFTSRLKQKLERKQLVGAYHAIISTQYALSAFASAGFSGAIAGMAAKTNNPSFLIGSLTFGLIWVLNAKRYNRRIRKRIKNEDANVKSWSVRMSGAYPKLVNLGSAVAFITIINIVILLHE